jgi:periplasmic protein TonB
MSTSPFCIQQRQQEQQKLKKLLILGFTSSALLHGILAWAIPKWSVEPPKVAKPMELIIVDKPQPKPIPKPQPKVETKPIVEPKPIPKPEPKVEPEPIVEPKPIPQPEPIKAKTPPPPVKPPEPVKTQTAPPKPTPQKVLTTPTPQPSAPIVPTPIAKKPSLNNSFTTSDNSTADIPENTSGNPGNSDRVATSNSAPPDSESSGIEGISCVSNCEPEYPTDLAGAEGNAGVKLTIDSEGNVIGAELITPHSNSQINRQALLAAREMQFSSPSGGAASVQVKIEFTMAGSEYDRLAREAQEKREQAEKEREEQAAARQRQLEQARQQQLQQQRQAQQQQLEPKKPAATQPQSKPVPNSQTEPKPLPALLETEPNDEMLRKFQERIEQRQ